MRLQPRKHSLIFKQEVNLAIDYKYFKIRLIKQEQKQNVLILFHTHYQYKYIIYFSSRPIWNNFSSVPAIFFSVTNKFD